MVDKVTDGLKATRKTIDTTLKSWYYTYMYEVVLQLAESVGMTEPIPATLPVTTLPIVQWTITREQSQFHCWTTS